MEAREKREVNVTDRTRTDGNLTLDSDGAVHLRADEKIWIDREKLLREDRSYWYVRRAQDAQSLSVRSRE